MKKTISTPIDDALLDRIEDLKFQLRESERELEHARKRRTVERAPRPPARVRSEDPELDALSAMHHSLAQRHAKRWPTDPHISYEDLIAIHQCQAGKCFYTGLPYELTQYFKDGLRNPLSASVDRVDNTKGYIAGNVVLCVWFANAAKGAWPLQVICPLWGYLPAVSPVPIPDIVHGSP